MVSAREIGTELLERWALGYLGRLRQLGREFAARPDAARSAARSRGRAQPAKPLIDAIVTRYREAGLLDDAAYAAGRATVAAIGAAISLKAIRARLAAKGVAAGVAVGAVGALRELGPDPDLAAACAFARRRRLGPFRRAAADRARELAAFARAGFSRRIAEAVLACADAGGGCGARPRRARLTRLQARRRRRVASSGWRAVVERRLEPRWLRRRARARWIPCLSKAILTSRLKARPTTHCFPAMVRMRTSSTTRRPCRAWSTPW